MSVDLILLRKNLQVGLNSKLWPNGLRNRDWHVTLVLPLRLQKVYWWMPLELGNGEGLRPIYYFNMTLLADIQLT